MSSAAVLPQVDEWHSVLSHLQRAQAALSAAVPSSLSDNATALVEHLTSVVAELTARLSTVAPPLTLPPYSSMQSRSATLLDASGAEAADEDDDGCSGLDGVWSPGLHVMAIFIVLAASAVGVLFPLVGKWVPVLRLPDFVYATGKAIAIGVMLGVSLIHMLAESAEQFEAPCVPAHLTEMYGSWPFLFAIIAFVLMHALDSTIQDVATTWAMQRAVSDNEPDKEDQEDAQDGASAGTKSERAHAKMKKNVDAAQRCVEALMDPNMSSRSPAPCESHTAANLTAPAPVSTGLSPACARPHSSSASSASTNSLDLPLDARRFCPVHGEEEKPCTATRIFDEVEMKLQAGDHDVEAAFDSTGDAPAAPLSSHFPDHTDSYHHHHHHDAETADDEAHGHSHGYIAAPDTMPVAQRVVAAVALEFGVTLHSVIIGLTMGITTNQELRTLVVALCFHQLFEGVAMGSRLADASFHRGVELALAMLFVVSAPIGTAIGTAIVSGSRSALSGTSFVLTCAIFNAVCGGILLYLTASLLLYDFAADLKRFAAPHAPRRFLKRAVLFAGFWVGAGAMALIGKWL